MEREPAEGGEHLRKRADLKTLTGADAAFLGGAEPEQIARSRTAKEPLQAMVHAPAVLVDRAAAGFFNRDGHAGSDIEDFFAGGGRVEGIGAMHVDAGFALIPIALGADLELAA